MSYDDPGAGALDYFPCRYGRSKLLFRGPRRKLEGASYVAVIGGSETFGKFVPVPWPERLERAAGTPVVNFGFPNAGVDVFLTDPFLLDTCNSARLTVIQLLPPQNMSNRFYAVHPRRNDRFLRASALLKTLFREVDFAECHFTGHLLQVLHAASAEKYRLVEQELKSAWLARMRQMLARITGKTLLLHLSGPEDALIDAAMIDALRPHATGCISVAPSAAALAAGTEGMVFPPMEQPQAARLPGPLIHAEIAAAVAPELSRLL